MHVPTAQPAPPPTLVKPLATMFPNTPTPKSARFVTTNTLEEVVSAHVDGWLVEDRFTAPRSLAQSNTLDMHWYITVSERLMRHQAPGGVSPAPLSTAPAPSAAGAPSTSEEIAVARKEGDRILLANTIQALFDNITDSKVIALRHRPSGLICRFDPGSASAVVMGRAAAATNRADAVNCLSTMNAFANVLTIMPNRDRLTTDQALAAAAGAMRAVYSDLRPFTGQGVRMTGNPSLPGHLVARMVSASTPDQIYFYVSAAVVGDWIVTEQVHGPMSPPMVGDLMGELNMISAIGDLEKAKSPAPVGGPPPT
jgi:hypothetical protein